MTRAIARIPHRMLLMALSVACAAQPAAAQRSAVAGYLESLTSGLREFVAGPPPPAQVPRSLRPCGSLYGPEARQIARGPELLNSYERWIHGTYQVTREMGPLPVCFEHRQDTLTTNQGRFLLAVNNHYLRRHRESGYRLTGHTDPQERDLAVAHRRAEEIHLKSAGPECRYQVTRREASTLLDYRKVRYTSIPAPPGCGAPPGR